VLAEGSSPIDLTWATRHPTFGGPPVEGSAFALAVTWARLQAGLGPVRGVAVHTAGVKHPWWAHHPPLGPLYNGTERELMDVGYVISNNDTLTVLVPADCWLAKETHHVRK